MKTVYKIDGTIVERDTFNSLVHDMLLFNIWEKTILAHKEELEKGQISVNFKLVKGKMQVLTDTQMLFKLNHLVKKEMFKILKLQSVPIHQ
jgi:hypothetical protein